MIVFMLLLEHPHTVYIIITRNIFFIFQSTTAIILQAPPNTILHSSHRSSEASKTKKKCSTMEFYLLFFGCFVYCCYSHVCGIIAFYIYVELLYAYIVVNIYIIHFMTANVYVDTILNITSTDRNKARDKIE